MSDDETDEPSIGQSLSNLSLDPSDEKDLENDLLNHVLLPRFLPHTKHTESYEHELELLQRMVELIEVQDEWIPTSTIEMLRNLNYIQADCLPETIFEQINALTPGNTFAMFVKCQNCVFVIYMPPTDIKKPNETTTVILATFPGNFDPKIINKTIDDFEVNKISGFSSFLLTK